LYTESIGYARDYTGKSNGDLWIPFSERKINVQEIQYLVRWNSRTQTIFRIPVTCRTWNSDDWHCRLYRSPGICIGWITLSLHAADPTTFGQAMNGIFNTIKAIEIANRTTDAFMYNQYGLESWINCIELLYSEGYNATEIKEMLRSKHMRWADDGCAAETYFDIFHQYYFKNKHRLRADINEWCHGYRKMEQWSG